MGSASLLTMRSEDREKSQRRLNAILQASERGSQLVKQLLMIARKTDIEQRPVAINDLLREVTKLLAETFPKSIEVVVQLTAGQPIVMGDANQLHQVLMNLCVNARDAMPDGGTLTVATQIVAGQVAATKHAGSAKFEYVSLTVSDNGTGMDEETRNHAFDPFFTTKEKGKGTGLGLAVVLGIIEKHGGFVEIQSTRNVGTTIQLLLPSATESFAAPEQSSENIDAAPRGHERILFVEDEALTRDVVCDCLQNRGYSVLAAGDGEEGMRFFEEGAQRFDLVLSDLGLPKLDGEELCKRIRKSGSPVPFLLLSGFIDPERKGRLSEAGVSEMIQKPYKLGDLLVRIRSILDHHRA